jgi:hypothetical protein
LTLLLLLLLWLLRLVRMRLGPALGLAAAAGKKV